MRRSSIRVRAWLGARKSLALRQARSPPRARLRDYGSRVRQSTNHESYLPREPQGILDSIPYGSRGAMPSCLVRVGFWSGSQHR